MRALEYMLDNDWFDKGITRYGSELEMVLVDKTTLKPVNLAMDIIEAMDNVPWAETELAKFNLEINLTPRELKGMNFSLTEKEILTRLSKLDKTLSQFNASYILTGILPTIQKFHLTNDNITPRQRYFALIEAFKKQRQSNYFELKIFGIDELFVKHNSAFLEAANTSWQVHLQVDPANYVKMYNIAQTLAAPSMAVAANSPIVFGKRLWHESRIAMFEQALDTRSMHEHMREQSTRVSFGKDWLNNSILDIYREDIARFRVLLSTAAQEDALEKVYNNEVPKLNSLLVHNSTVYRWNRPQFGKSANGKPHLRIENRVMPAGPTVKDQVANAAFWLGMMTGMGLKYDDIRDHISFSSLRDNFGRSARFGMEAELTWLKGKKIHALDLIKKELLPIARAGLKHHNVAPEDIDEYLGVIRERVGKRTNGAIWMLNAYDRLLKNNTSKDEALSVLTYSIMKNQKTNTPVHKWKMPRLQDLVEYMPLNLKVSEFMVTDLFTVQNDDIIELVAELMDWWKIRYMPVEDARGNMVGLVSIRLVLRNLVKSSQAKEMQNLTVEDIMIKNPITISPETSILDAMRIMQKKRIGALPVKKNKTVVGIITEKEFLTITSRLLERLHASNK